MGYPIALVIHGGSLQAHSLETSTFKANVAKVYRGNSQKQTSSYHMLASNTVSLDVSKDYVSNHGSLFEEIPSLLRLSYGRITINYGEVQSDYGKLR